MGVMDWMDDEAESGESPDDDFDEFEDEMDEFEGDESDAAEELADEFGDDDEFSGGEFDDFGDDDFGDDDFGGSAVDTSSGEFEDRIGELENQVSSISSDMNTVRQENIQIGETVDELDDTIRKLLDIYEMVTRGINPFVDDAREMGGLDGDGGAFGLFDAEQEQDDERLDSGVAEADAESFFDEDLGSLDAAEGQQKAEVAAEDELGEEERDAVPDLDAADDAGGDTTAEGTSASFDDLKAEYDRGDGMWDDADHSDGATDVAEEAADADAADADASEDTDVDADVDAAVHATDLADDPVESDESDEALPGAESDGVDAREIAGHEEPTESHPESATVTGSKTPVGNRDGPTDATSPDADGATGDARSDAGAVPAPADTRPVEADASSADTDAEGGSEADADRSDDAAYLAEMPRSYVGETMLLKWASYLVSNGGTRGAMRAVAQYRDMGWLSASVAAEFEEYVLGAADAKSVVDGDLTVDHHTTSLAYLTRLAGDAPDPGPAAAATQGGEDSGLRR